MRCHWVSSLIAAAVLARAPRSFAQEAASPLHITADDPDAQLVAEGGPLLVSDAPESADRACNAPCDRRVTRQQRVLVRGPGIVDSPVFLLPTSTSTLVVRSVRRASMYALETRRALLFGAFSAFALPTIGVGAAFGWYSRENIGGLTPGGIQERLLVATVTMSSLAVAALIAGIVNEALRPGATRVFDERNHRLAVRIGLDGVTF